MEQASVGERATPIQNLNEKKKEKARELGYEED